MGELFVSVVDITHVLIITLYTVPVWVQHLHICWRKNIIKSTLFFYVIKFNQNHDSSLSLKYFLIK